MSKPKPRYLTTTRALRVRPGDKIVVSLPFKITVAMGEKIKEQFVPLFPGHQIIVLEDGMKVGIVRPEKPPEEGA